MQAVRALLYLIQIILPWIVRVLPDIPGLARFIAVLNGLHVSSLTDEDAARAYNRVINWRPRSAPNFNDAAHVIKISDAISCIQGEVNNRSHWLSMLRTLCVSLIDQSPGSANGMARLGDATVDCLRQKALRQDTPRVTRTRTGSVRPALGHGHGR